MSSSRLAAVILALSIAAPAHARTFAWALTSENDAIFRHDEYYTNGIEISLVNDPDDVPHFVASGLDGLCGLFGSSCGSELSGSLRLIPFGNAMFTPNDIRASAYLPNDRPYAGWTYLGAVREMVDKDSGQRDRLRTFDLRVGIIGPYSGTKQIQDETHRILDGIINVVQPQGWDNQISTRAGINFRYEDERAIPLSATQPLHFVPHVGIALGNIYRYVNAGGFIVFGAGSRPFNSVTSHTQMEPIVPHFDNGVSNHGTNGAGGDTQPSAVVTETSYFAGIDARAMGYNLFLEGKEGSNIEMKHFVYDYIIGARHVTSSGLILSASIVQRSEEFYGSGIQRFMSVTIGHYIN